MKTVPDPTLTWEDPGCWDQEPQKAGPEDAPAAEIGVVPDATLNWEDSAGESVFSPEGSGEIGELPDPTLSWEDPAGESASSAEETGGTGEFPAPLLRWEDPAGESASSAEEAGGSGEFSDPLLRWEGPENPAPADPDAVKEHFGGEVPEPSLSWEEQAPEKEPLPTEAEKEIPPASKAASFSAAEPDPVLPPELQRGMSAPSEPRSVHLLTPATDSAWGVPVSRRVVPTAAPSKTESKKRTVPKDTGCWQCS
ncbi:hypothetical protein H8S23_10640 [Anaerofilum sp. BX8]|uniref:Uncharacterized protein n=1 Tax=Anaerofilum hominis TaxID=2763016 RepID=A0A923I7Z7_9FIRM|nr:hypothetical protein [Anaerofilum hominis]MBC5581965.1 hypothetical protein [Anaerofilum hominis]